MFARPRRDCCPTVRASPERKHSSSGPRIDSSIVRRTRNGPSHQQPAEPPAWQSRPGPTIGAEVRGPGAPGCARIIGRVTQTIRVPGDRRPTAYVVRPQQRSATTPGLCCPESVHRQSQRGSMKTPPETQAGTQRMPVKGGQSRRRWRLVDHRPRCVEPSSAHSQDPPGCAAVRPRGDPVCILRR
jgi:hypothetical protein